MKLRAIVYPTYSLILLYHIICVCQDVKVHFIRFRGIIYIKAPLSTLNSTLNTAKAAHLRKEMNRPVIYVIGKVGAYWI